MLSLLFDIKYQTKKLTIHTHIYESHIFVLLQEIIITTPITTKEKE